VNIISDTYMKGMCLVITKTSSLYARKAGIDLLAFVLDSWSLKKGPLFCHETSVKHYHYPLRNTSEERSSHRLCGGSLISRSRVSRSHIKFSSCLTGNIFRVRYTDQVAKGVRQILGFYGENYGNHINRVCDRMLSFLTLQLV